MKDQLEQFVREHNLVQKTFDHFWEYYDAFLSDEDTGEIIRKLALVDRNSICAELYGYSFWVSGDLDFEHIKVYIDCFLKGESEKFATYWCVYDMEGNLFDDYFAVEPILSEESQAEMQPPADHPRGILKPGL